MAGGQTIQQLKSGQSATEFLMSLPTSFEAQILYMFVAAGVVGMLANFFQKWARNEIEFCILAYLFKDYARGTALAFSGIVGAALTAISTDYFVPNLIFSGWKTVMITGVTTGFFFDAIGNRGKAKVWTEEEREAEKARLAGIRSR